MEENIKVCWLTDHEQTKIAPKTLSTQILNADGTQFKNTVETSISEIDGKITAHSNNSEIHVTKEEKEAWSNIEIPSLDGYATEEYVENLYTKLNTNTVLGFYCVEDVTIVTNGISKVYPANSNVEIKFIEDDVFEIIPTSDSSILSLSAFPGALGTFYPWLEGVAQFSNILFDMNAEDMYSKWSQGNQGSYHVQSAQYINCIFWSDNPYISDVSKRTNYTLTHTSQLPLCYSTIPDNTFKSFYLAFGVNSDPNWGNKAYRDSFAKATWATQVFSYYGARIIGIVGHDDPDFNIVLPKDCRGLMFDARDIESAGVFDAANVTNFGAKSGSWREAFGDCTSLRRLYIKNLKVNLNISWSPIDYNSIYFIISSAANTNAITISVSPYTYNLLGPSDFELAASKNITIALLTSNYVEDRRLSDIANKANSSDLAELQGLVGDTAVADQIAEAIDAIPQSDWSQNDPAAIDYVKNRTHGVFEATEAILCDSTYDFASAPTHSDGFLVTRYVNDVMPGYHLIPGQTYTVVWNDTVYNCIARNDDLGSVYIGSQQLAVNWFFIEYIESDEPFFIVASMDGTYSEINTALNTQISVKITNVVENIQVLDEKFLPDSIKLSAGLKVEGNTYTVDNKEYIAEFGAEVFNNYIENIAVGEYSHAEGDHTEALAMGAHAEGDHTKASGLFSHAEGDSTKATKVAAHAEGGSTTASGNYSHAEGCDTEALGDYSHTEGRDTQAEGSAAHAEGQETIASGYISHAEGYKTTASGYYSHAEGQETIASNEWSHAEGYKTTASGVGSHAQGYETTALGDGSYAEGFHTIARGVYQHVQGYCNIEDTFGVYAHIVGNGTDITASKRSNAHTLDWDGNAWFAGNVKVGGTGQDDTTAKTLATTEDVATQIGTKANASDLTALSALVGDTAVSEQINNAVTDIDAAVDAHEEALFYVDDTIYECIYEHDGSFNFNSNLALQNVVDIKIDPNYTINPDVNSHTFQMYVGVSDADDNIVYTEIIDNGSYFATFKINDDGYTFGGLIFKPLVNSESIPSEYAKIKFVFNFSLFKNSSIVALERRASLIEKETFVKVSGDITSLSDITTIDKKFKNKVSNGDMVSVTLTAKKSPREMIILYPAPTVSSYPYLKSMVEFNEDDLTLSYYKLKLASSYTLTKHIVSFANSTPTFTSEEISVTNHTIKILSRREEYSEII